MEPTLLNQPDAPQGHVYQLEQSQIPQMNDIIIL